jgi:adenylate cyclase
MGSQTTVQTTVVFADLMGSTSLFEATGNARATQAVTQLTQWICGVFLGYGGYIVKTLGDGVLATFSDSTRAIDAVVELQRQHQKTITQTTHFMPIRIGVASGEVEMVAGDCYGDAVNVAARLSDLSGANQIRGRAEPASVFQIEWKIDEGTDFLTMQADIETLVPKTGPDALGGEIELKWLDTVQTFRSFDLPIHIGRVRTVEFVVNDPRVSREHARIDWRNGSVILVDVSTYGCWVRFAGTGSDIQLRRNECVLHGKGEIALGAPFSDISVSTVSFSVS